MRDGACRLMWVRGPSKRALLPSFPRGCVRAVFVLMVASAKKAGALGKAAASASSAGGSDGGALKAGVTRFLGRRDTEDYADRAIAEHFPQASKAAVTQARVGGKTLRERVIDARRSAKTSDKRMGALFWSELRSQYLSDVSSEFKVLGKSQEISLGLIDALLKATSKSTAVRNRQHLVAWVSTARAINQREMCGLLRHLSDQHPGRNKAAHEHTKLPITNATTNSAHHPPAASHQPPATSGPPYPSSLL